MQYQYISIAILILLTTKLIATPTISIVGTWDNCVGYQWQVENDNLSLIENSLATLGGCYCINASCGDAGRTKQT